MFFFGLNASALITFVCMWVLLIAHLSTVTDLTNQIVIPESGKMNGWHQNKVYRRPHLFLPQATLSSLSSPIFFFGPLHLGVCSHVV